MHNCRPRRSAPSESDPLFEHSHGTDHITKNARTNQPQDERLQLIGGGGSVVAEEFRWSILVANHDIRIGIAIQIGGGKSAAAVTGGEVRTFAERQLEAAIDIFPESRGCR
ncbi:MAG UNVERIFIED_CONTAM: hypothetical protein LVR18_30595 [Planctomycetaceae bacterium]|jgi:hypothetical protein